MTEQQELLEEPDVRKRFELLSYKVVQEIRVQNIKDELQTKIKERVDKNQREYILREELKLIREELGDETTLSDADEFQQAADALKAPAEVKEKISKEIKRFRNSMNSPAEAGVIRTYIETMLELPWDKTCRGQQRYRLCEAGAGRGSLRPGEGEGAGAGVSGGPRPDQEGRCARSSVW